MIRSSSRPTRRAIWSVGLLCVMLISAGCGSAVPSAPGPTAPPASIPPSPVPSLVASTPSPSAAVASNPDGTLSVAVTLPARGSLDDSNPGYVAVELLDGRILIAGGADANDQAVASAQLYLPATNLLEPTGSMKAARTDFSATTLDDGRVLIAGGADATNGNATASAELYDPALRGFVHTGSMKTARENQSAVKLPDGRVLIVGGDQGCWQDQCKLVNSAEIYDPASGTFKILTAALPGRLNDVVALLPDGHVLIAGGENAGGDVLASAQVLDPASGRISHVGSLTVPRDYASVTRLEDGQMLIVGGFNDSSSSDAAPSAEIYDMAAGVFKRTGDMDKPLIPSVAILLPDGRVLITGSPISSSGDSGLASASIQLFDPATKTFATTGSLSKGFAPTIGLLLSDGQVFIYGHDYAGAGDLDAIVLYAAPRA